MFRPRSAITEIIGYPSGGSRRCAARPGQAPKPGSDELLGYRSQASDERPFQRAPAKLIPTAAEADSGIPLSGEQ